MYIIDGHNLVPFIPGLSLSDVDDEEKLIGLLQTYARVRRRQVVVFFDDAPPGYAGVRTYGSVQAHFVPVAGTADEAIRRYLVGMRGRARTATVVSSDRRLQTDARSLHASIIPSDEFASDLLAAQVPKAGTKAETQRTMSEQELTGWLDLFGIDPERADAPILPTKRKKPESGSPKKSNRKSTRSHHGFSPKTDK